MKTEESLCKMMIQLDSQLFYFKKVFINRFLPAFFKCFTKNYPS